MPADRSISPHGTMRLTRIAVLAGCVALGFVQVSA